MKALYCPGPAYYSRDVREVAGWAVILDLMAQGLSELGYEEVAIPNVDERIISESPAARVAMYGLAIAAYTRNEHYDLVLAPPGYGVGAFMTHPEARKVAYVWNNADRYRQETLDIEHRRFGRRFEVPAEHRWVNDMGLKMADHLLACSPWVKATHQQQVPDKPISIAFWGVDSERFTPAERTAVRTSLGDPFRVMFLGSDVIRKGLFHLMQGLDLAFPEPVDPSPEVWIVGTGQPNLLPEGIPEPANVVTKVFGNVPNADIPRVIRECDVMCIPTVEDGIALAIQEGMASGLVPVTTPECGEVFEDEVSGFIVPYRDPGAVAGILRKLYDSPVLRASVGLNARKLAEQQTWANFLADFKTIIAAVQEDAAAPVFESEMPWMKERA